jgi:hypothetical protein
MERNPLGEWLARKKPASESNVSSSTSLSAVEAFSRRLTQSQCPVFVVDAPISDLASSADSATEEECSRPKADWKACVVNIESDLERFCCSSACLSPCSFESVLSLRRAYWSLADELHRAVFIFLVTNSTPPTSFTQQSSSKSKWLA